MRFLTSYWGDEGFLDELFVDKLVDQVKHVLFLAADRLHDVPQCHHLPGKTK